MLPGAAERRDLEHLSIRVLVTDLYERELRGQGERGVNHAPRVAGRQVHLDLALRVSVRQFGEPPVQLEAASQCAVDDGAAIAWGRPPGLAGCGCRAEVLLDLGVDDLVDR